MAMSMEMLSVSSSEKYLLEKISRASLPMPRILKREFSEDGVDEPFLDVNCKWERHSSRRGKTNVSSERATVLVKHFNYPISTQKSNEWALENGFLPTDEKECYAFGINPETQELQLQFWVVSLGVSTIYNGAPSYPALGKPPALDESVGKRVLRCLWQGGLWSPATRFLLIQRPN